MGLTFLARRTNVISNFCGDGNFHALTYNVIDVSVNNCFSSGLFTAPATGDYIFASALSLGNITSHNVQGIWVIQDVTSLRQLWMSEICPANVFVGTDSSFVLAGGGVFLPISLRKGQQLAQIVNVSSSPVANTVSLNGSSLYNQLYWAGFQVA